MSEKAEHLILVINPGSTSTKLALFRGNRKIAAETVAHPAEQLQAYAELWDQFDLRLDAALEFLKRHGVSLNELSAVVGRGGLLKPVQGGTYRVNATMIADARRGVQGEH
ncbi:MAG: butyrate kinase, partial [Calditrichaeota bacterium]|nr:butyrate kinase [Calditrichota bacterium]